MLKIQEVKIARASYGGDSGSAKVQFGPERYQTFDVTLSDEAVARIMSSVRDEVAAELGTVVLNDELAAVDVEEPALPPYVPPASALADLDAPIPF
jgi:hypothetical protein